MTENKLPELTQDQQRKEHARWQKHLHGLKGQVDDESLRMALMWVAEPKQIGYGQGQIRPGELGRWDIFFELEIFGVSRAERLLLAGLTEEQLNEAERRDWLEINFVDPDNPQEVAEFDMVEAMPDGERKEYLTGRIHALEKILGLEKLDDT
jgi:hypothetical protein